MVLRRCKNGFAIDLLNGAGGVLYAECTQPRDLNGRTCAQAIAQGFGEGGDYLVAGNSGHGARDVMIRAAGTELQLGYASEHTAAAGTAATRAVTNECEAPAK